MMSESVQTWQPYLDNINATNLYSNQALLFQDLFGQDEFNCSFDTFEYNFDSPVPEPVSSSSDSRRSSLSESSSIYYYNYNERRQLEEDILDKITNRLDPDQLPGILTILSEEVYFEDDYEDDEDGEIEIDLTCLNYNQLVRVLSYVDSCINQSSIVKIPETSSIVEETIIPLSPLSLLSDEEDLECEEEEKVFFHQQLIMEEDEVVKEEEILFHPQQKSKNSNDSKMKNVTKTVQKSNKKKDSSSLYVGHMVAGHTTTSLSSAHGPLSMTGLTELETRKKALARRRANNKKSNHHTHQHENRNHHQKRHKNNNHNKRGGKKQASPSASSLRKQKAIANKRRILEDMDMISDDDDDEKIIVFGDEQMDLGVTDNKTIVHPRSISQSVYSQVTKEEVEEDDDEEIDIML